MALALGLVAPMLVLVVAMLQVREFTVDDAYISFRYAENLARGDGLVYNVGQRVEGYSNFLWTVLLALVVRLGGSIEPAAKLLGALCAGAALVPTYLLSRRLLPHGAVPCLATWLLATSFVFTGYAVFGLETPLFLALTLTGTELFFREEGRDRASPSAPGPLARGLPLSGLCFALAALTRPEGPLFLLLLVVWQPSPLLGRRSLLRLSLFAAPVAAHLLFRHAYYGAWVPNTLLAKTGGTAEQLKAGREYLTRYVAWVGPLLWLSLGGASLALARRRRDALGVASVALVLAGYVVLVGGDWMPFFRFFAPFEPFCFLLVDHAARAVFEQRDRALSLALGAFCAVAGYQRVATLADAQRSVLEGDKRFWDDSAGKTAEWLLKNAEPGPIAIADIGYVGYRTGFPVVDVLGLLDPAVAKLPGGYLQKVGPGFTDLVYGREPRYILLISSDGTCRSPTIPSARALFSDSRFEGYGLRQPMQLRGGGWWCIYEKHGPG